MKKKIYIVPQTFTVNVKLQQIMQQASGGNRLMSGEAEAEGEVLSRESGRNSLWDDED